jgi:hypothetical protein
MRIYLRAVLAFGAVCLLQTVSFAATLMVAGSGIFSGSAPTTTFSAPNTTWSFSFNVSDVPVVANPTANGFDVPFSSFTYHLGAGTVATTPARIRFFTSGIGGLFNIDIADTLSPPDGNPVTGFEFSDGQAFSGTTANPTILTGAYPATSASFISGGAVADSFSGVTVNITATGTPEPATLAMAAIACCLFGWMRHRQSVKN